MVDTADNLHSFDFTWEIGGGIGGMLVGGWFALGCTEADFCNKIFLGLFMSFRCFPFKRSRRKKENEERITENDKLVEIHFSVRILNYFSR